MKKIVVFTGAGVSAESGLKTFRDSDGLWENYKVEEVATPMAWVSNRKLVLDFYNQRRKQVLEAKPNAAHKALVKLEEKYDVHIITQNIDDLHERAGSKNVLHLHGQIRKARSTVDPSLIYDIVGWEIKEGEKCEKGSQLRPHIVWFGEMVPELENAAYITSGADVLIIIGTSLQVYPAASLIHYAPAEAEKYYVDPYASQNYMHGDITCINKKASEGVTELVDQLLSN